MSEIQKDNALLHNLKGWSNLTSEDLSIHKVFQKSELTVELVESYLAELESVEPNEESYHYVFRWSIYLRDFTILLRDSLLSMVKYDQYRHDEKEVDTEFEVKLRTLIISAAKKVIADASSPKLEKNEIDWFKHQKSPTQAVLGQIKDLNIQLKKIYRSHDKVNEIRLNLESFKREFHVQFQKQTTAVDELVEHIVGISELINEIHPTGTRVQVEKAIDQLTEAFTKLELMQSMESMELMSYVEKNALNIPIDIVNYKLESKSLDIQVEMSKWFSANIYPHIIDLENRRNLSIERSLTALSKGRIKLSALILEENDDYDLAKTNVKVSLNQLLNDYIKPLVNEKAEGSEKISAHFDEELFASAIYDRQHLFLSNNGSVQITNISRDAQKRMASQFKITKRTVYSWLRNSLAKYVELDRTPFNTFVSNKLVVNKDDERLSLFLKKGYLGKTFMVSRQDVIDPVLSDHKHWKNGYSAAVMIYGSTGSGKSAILGMLSQLSLEEEVITINPGEPYFTNSRSFLGSYVLMDVIENIAYQNIGKKVILAIDDLGLWHTESKHLFDNITELLALIKKYKGDIYFVVSANSYLKSRLEGFKDLELCFSSILEVGPVDSELIKEALIMRFKALPELGLSDTQHENTLGSIVRNAKGNLGHAMLEYSRFYEDDYNPNLKSHNFVELIRENGTLLKYISCFQQLKISDMTSILNELDFRDFDDNIHYLIGQKILVYVKSNVIAINPFLVHSIENVLNKLP